MITLNGKKFAESESEFTADCAGYAEVKMRSVILTTPDKSMAVKVAVTIPRDYAGENIYTYWSYA